MLNCEKCGKKYSYGRKIYHECDNIAVSQGVIFADSKSNHDWNCVSTLNSTLSQIEERIIESYLVSSKVDSLYIYE